jgi:hypothetical protein
VSSETSEQQAGAQHGEAEGWQKEQHENSREDEETSREAQRSRHPAR